MIYGTLCVGCVIIFVPLAWMISTSLKDLKYVFVFPPQWIPSPIHWGNFRQALTILPFAIYFKNTMWNLLMAASLVIVLPPILIFFVAQRYFIQGIVFTGVKG